MTSSDYRVLDAGERALIVEFGDRVDPHINARVLALDAALAANRPAGVLETVPTYRSLAIHYDPLRLARADLVAHVARLDPAHRAAIGPAARWTFPCRLDEGMGEDLNEVARLAGLTRDRAATLFSGAVYRAYMYGLAPGWCYLGGLPAELALSRRSGLRPPTPNNAILVGGGLALVAVNSMPTGWYVVGRTPERMFALDRAPPFLVGVGDEIVFSPVDPATFAALEARVAAGEIVARRTALA